MTGRACKADPISIVSSIVRPVLFSGVGTTCSPETVPIFNGFFSPRTSSATMFTLPSSEGHTTISSRLVGMFVVGQSGFGSQVSATVETESSLCACQQMSSLSSSGVVTRTFSSESSDMEKIVFPMAANTICLMAPSFVATTGSKMASNDRTVPAFVSSRTGVRHSSPSNTTFFLVVSDPSGATKPSTPL